MAGGCGGGGGGGGAANAFVCGFVDAVENDDLCACVRGLDVSRGREGGGVGALSQRWASCRGFAEGCFEDT